MGHCLKESNFRHHHHQQLSFGRPLLDEVSRIEYSGVDITITLGMRFGDCSIRLKYSGRCS